MSEVHLVLSSLLKSKQTEIWAVIHSKSYLANLYSNLARTRERLFVYIKARRIAQCRHIRKRRRRINWAHKPHWFSPFSRFEYVKIKWGKRIHFSENQMWYQSEWRLFFTIGERNTDRFSVHICIVWTWHFHLHCSFQLLNIS